MSRFQVLFIRWNLTSSVVLKWVLQIFKISDLEFSKCISISEFFWGEKSPIDDTVFWKWIILSQILCFWEKKFVKKWQKTGFFEDGVVTYKLTMVLLPIVGLEVKKNVLIITLYFKHYYKMGAVHQSPFTRSMDSLLFNWCTPKLFIRVKCES